MAYRRDNRGGGNTGKKYGKRNYGERSFGDKPVVTMHSAICSECDNECEVPFKPSGDKPVYCRECFRNKGESTGGGAPQRDFSERRSAPTTMHMATCDDCGSQCQVPFRPTGEKPVYCHECFGKNGGGKANRERSRGVSTPSGVTGISKEQFEILNLKLDKIIAALDSEEHLG